MIELSPHAEGTVLRVKAQPGARRNAVVGEHAGALRVAVSAAPEKGKANEAVLGVLADALGCKPSQLGVIAGAAARDKKVLVAGLTPEQLRPRLDGLLARPSE